MWAALGAAAALKAKGVQAKADAKAAGETAKDMRVVVVYAQPGEVPAALWRKALTYAAAEGAAGGVCGASGAEGTERAGGLTQLAHGCGVPGIPVDADDAVAIYRVAQESIGRARIGGGPGADGVRAVCGAGRGQKGGGARWDCGIGELSAATQGGDARYGWSERRKSSPGTWQGRRHPSRGLPFPIRNAGRVTAPLAVTLVRVKNRSLEVRVRTIIGLWFVGVASLGLGWGTAWPRRRPHRQQPSSRHRRQRSRQVSQQRHRRRLRRTRTRLNRCRGTGRGDRSRREVRRRRVLRRRCRHRSRPRSRW